MNRRLGLVSLGEKYDFLLSVKIIISFMSQSLLTIGELGFCKEGFCIIMVSIFCNDFYDFFLKYLCLFERVNMYQRRRNIQGFFIRVAVDGSQVINGVLVQCYFVVGLIGVRIYLVFIFLVFNCIFRMDLFRSWQKFYI